VLLLYVCKKYYTVFVLFYGFYAVSAGDKSQSPSLSSGSQQNLAHSSLSSALSYDDKPQIKEPTSKSGKRVGYASAGRQYQVFYIVLLSVKLSIGRLLLLLPLLLLLFSCHFSSRVLLIELLMNCGQVFAVY